MRTPLPATDSLSPWSPQTSPSFCSLSGFILYPEPPRPSPRAACSAAWRISRVPGRAVILLFLALALSPHAIAQDVRIGVFFFQAEDGIRDPLVTGVQTCALPI